MQKITKRRWSIELLRILACLSVIGLHISLSTTNTDNQMIPSRIFLWCLDADGVAIFFIITGFYIFNNYDYPKRLKNLFIKLFIPSFIVFIFAFYLYDWVFNDVSFINSIQKSPEDYYQILLTFFTQKQLPYVSHYWYISTYIWVIIISPIIYQVYRLIIKSRIISLIYIIICMALLLTNDIAPETIFTDILEINTLIRAILVVIYGAIIWNNRNILNSKLWIVISPILVIIINIMRSLIHIYLLPENSYLMLWSSFAGTLNATLIFKFCISLEKFKINKHIQTTILAIGKQTYWVYLVHVFIINGFTKIGVQNWLQTILCINGPHSFIKSSLYYTLLSISVFIASFIISYTFYKFTIFIKSLIIKKY